MMNVLGIDLSLQSTGLAMIGRGYSVYLKERTKDYKIYGDILGDRIPLPDEDLFFGVKLEPKQPPLMPRWREILGVINAFVQVSQVILIEGYSYGSFLANSRAIAEIGGLVRYNILDVGKTYTEIPPKTLKRFITSKGNAEKNVVLKEVYKRWGIDVDSDDVADAVGLCKMGQAMNGIGLDGLKDFQRHVVDEIMHPRPKPKKKGRKSNNDLFEAE